MSWFWRLTPLTDLAEKRKTQLFLDEELDKKILSECSKKCKDTMFNYFLTIRQMNRKMTLRLIDTSIVNYHSQIEFNLARVSAIHTQIQTSRDLCTTLHHINYEHAINKHFGMLREIKTPRYVINGSFYAP